MTMKNENLEKMRNVSKRGCIGILWWLAKFDWLIDCWEEDGNSFDETNKMWQTKNGETNKFFILWYFCFVFYDADGYWL